MADEELTEALKNKRWYLTSKTIWVWIACTILIAGWSVTSILWYNDSQANKKFRKDTQARFLELTTQDNTQNENISKLDGLTTNLGSLLSSGVEKNNKLIDWRLGTLEGYHRIFQPRPDTSFINTTPPPLQ